MKFIDANPKSVSKKDPLASLRDSYDVEDKRPERDYYILTCKTCGGRWSLKTVAGGVNGANILHLLDHYAGCVLVNISDD